MVEGAGLALGVFAGNWLVAPLIFKRTTMKKGFAIGAIAALLVLGIYAII